MGFHSIFGSECSIDASKAADARTSSASSSSPKSIFAWEVERSKAHYDRVEEKDAL